MRKKIDSKIVYVDGTDWLHEVGETDATVWPTLTSILDHTACAKSCGVVKCKITKLEWASPQNEDDPLTDEARIKMYENHIKWYQQKIDSLRQKVEVLKIEV